MSVSAQSWEDFIESVPPRVAEVIEDGPFPLKEYGASKLSYADKKRGICRYKGGGGRGSVTVKSGQAAVVYWDPDFCERGVENIPEPVEARHSMTEILRAFRNL